MPAAASMGLAGLQEFISARLPPQVLRASVVSMPAAASMGLAGHRSPPRRACLPKFCGHRDFPCRRGLPWICRRRDGSPPHRRAGFARFCWRRLSSRWRRRNFPRRRRGVRTRRHRTSLNARAVPLSVGPRRRAMRSDSERSVRQRRPPFRRRSHSCRRDSPESCADCTHKRPKGYSTRAKCARAHGLLLGLRQT